MDKSRESYIDTLSMRQKKIEKQIRELDIKIKKAKLFTKHSEIKRLALKEQLNDISREKIKYSRTNRNIYNDSTSIHGLDKVHDQQDKKIKEIKDQLYGTFSMVDGEPQYKEGLIALRDKLAGVKDKKKLDKKIEKKFAKLERLQKRESHVGKVQRSIIMSKRSLKRKKYKLMKQKAKVNYYKNKEDYVHGLRNGLAPSNTITGKAKGKILDKVYKHQEKKYHKKKQRQAEVLNEMKNKRFIGVVGANVIVMAKRMTNTMSDQDEIDRILNDNNNDPSISPEQHTR